MRQVRALAAMLARIAGLRMRGLEEQARAELANAYGLLLGPEAGLLRQLDAGTAATLLGSADRILAFALLLNEEAMQERAPDRRAALWMQAVALGIEAARRDREYETVRDFLKSVAPLVDREQLTPEQRAVLDECSGAGPRTSGEPDES